MSTLDDEERLLRSVALQNAASILQARQRAEQELLRTREALRESQQRLRAALSAAGAGTFRWDLRSKEVEWDGNLDRLLGLEPGLARQTLDALVAAVHPQERQGVIECFERCARDGTNVDIEFRVVWPDGSIHWVLAKAKAFADDSGALSYVTGACADISSRKQASEALSDETRVLELLNETGKTLASTLDLQAVIQAVTDAGTKLAGAEFGAFFYNVHNDDGDSYMLYTLSGAPREAFANFPMPRATSLFGPTFRGAPPILIDDVLSDSRYGQWGPHHGMPKGHLPVRSYLATPVHSRSGEVIGGLFFGHSHPGMFTERSQRLLSGLAAQAGIAIDNARLYAAAQRAAEERHALLESERAARSAAERMSEVKDEFLATLSHELRTPLNAILGWSQVLKAGPKGSADLAKGLEAIERNARAQTQLIEDLLDMSRITSGKLRLDIQSIQPISFIDAALETLKPAADAKALRIEKILDPLAGPIAGDAARLQQVVWNLLSNAIKFTPKEGKVQVMLERINSHIEITIADTGAGIRPEFLPYLFERFRQADASTTRKYGGLGLGLSIVKSLIELHGGTVQVQSPGEDQGTTVSVRLPLIAVHRYGDERSRLQPRTGVAPSAMPFGEVDLSGLKVLVVDDQIDARELIRRVLEECGTAVITAGSAAEALPYIESQRPDVLISDIGMPDTDGFELLRQVRALGAERGGRVPAIALTAFARSEDRTRALRSGFLVHVAKPVDPAELVATVATVAGRTGDWHRSSEEQPPN